MFRPFCCPFALSSHALPRRHCDQGGRSWSGSGGTYLRSFHLDGPYNSVVVRRGWLAVSAWMLALLIFLALTEVSLILLDC